MAAPNLAAVQTVTGKNFACAPTTSRTTLVPAVGAGKCVKLNCLFLANVDGGSPVDGTVELYDSSAATYFKIANTISVPADASINVLEKGPMYLEEGDKIEITASANGDLEATASGEELS